MSFAKRLLNKYSFKSQLVAKYISAEPFNVGDARKELEKEEKEAAKKKAEEDKEAAKTSAEEDKKLNAAIKMLERDFNKIANSYYDSRDNSKLRLYSDDDSQAEVGLVSGPEKSQLILYNHIITVYLIQPAAAAGNIKYQLNSHVYDDYAALEAAVSKELAAMKFLKKGKLKAAPSLDAEIKNYINFITKDFEYLAANWKDVRKESKEEKLTISSRAMTAANHAWEIMLDTFDQTLVRVVLTTYNKKLEFNVESGKNHSVYETYATYAEANKHVMRTLRELNFID